MTATVKLGAICWNQYTDWADLREAGIRADRLGFDSLWTWDHLYPIVGDHEGPIFEGWLALAAWAEATERATVGLMVGANTFRNPAVVAKMATTLDHISSGRAVLGIGGAWFETEHRGLGIEFGGSPGERLRWLDEAVQIMRGMLHGERPSGSQFYAAEEALNLPPPVQAHLPILIGGGGERRTLRTVAKYADACNLGGGVRERQAQGRDPAAALRGGRPRRVGDRAHRRCRHGHHPRHPRGGAASVRRHVGAHRNAEPWSDQPVGTADDVFERLRPFGEIGFRHLIVGFPSPHDSETMERLITDVKPRLAEAWA